MVEFARPFILLEFHQLMRYFFYCLSWTRYAILFLACYVSSNAYSYDLSKYDLRIITADSSESSKQISEQLLKIYPSAQLTSDLSKRSIKRPVINVAIGPSALRYLLSNDQGGIILSVFTSSQTFKSIVEDYPKRLSFATAVYAEPSPHNQFKLISLIYKRNTSVAVILSEKTEYLSKFLHASAAQAGVSLKIEIYNPDETLNKAINRVSSSTVLLALPDSAIYTSSTIKNILISTYRQNQPVIGFSSALVRAGALASTNSSIDDILAQGVEIINDIDSGQTIPEPQYPKYFSVDINEDVARSLNLLIDDRVRKFSRRPSSK